MISNSQNTEYPIRIAARMLNISVHTLRMYEKEGLILPRKKKSGHRVYSLSDISRLECIRSGIRDKKLTIPGIKMLYALIPCWEITGCPPESREKCAAFTSHDSPCWSFNHLDNFCTGKDCIECRVYKEFSECSSIKNSIIRLTRNK